MAQKKEHLKKLLDFIGMIVKDPENNDFKNGLQKLLGIDSTSTMPVVVNANMRRLIISTSIVLRRLSANKQKNFMLISLYQK